MPRRTFRPTYRLPVAAAAAAALLLAGCSSGGSPSANPTTTAAPAPGGSAGPSESSGPPTVSATGAYKPADAQGKAQNVPVPVMPALARENTKEGLEAFIRYWYAVLSYAYETGETGALDAVSKPSCALCRSLSDGIKTAWSDQRWVSGATIRAAAVEFGFDGSSPSQIAVVQVIQQRIEIRNQDGSLYQEPTPESNTASRAALTHEDDGWVMVDLGLIR
ncbi:DUF6318 family protein [Paenarthrobacter sp. NCHU4564]|uniref:DUF6318 family protein n=1 Tax=Paenarthrobacter sp. NCHU4564 TaxID=3451353 RepID=UPI003F943AB6